MTAAAVVAIAAAARLVQVFIAQLPKLLHLDLHGLDYGLVLLLKHSQLLLRRLRCLLLLPLRVICIALITFVSWVWWHVLLSLPLCPPVLLLRCGVVAPPRAFIRKHFVRLREPLECSISTDGMVTIGMEVQTFCSVSFLHLRRIAPCVDAQYIVVVICTESLFHSRGCRRSGAVAPDVFQQRLGSLSLKETGRFVRKSPGGIKIAFVQFLAGSL